MNHFWAQRVPAAAKTSGTDRSNDTQANYHQYPCPSRYDSSYKHHHQQQQQNRSSPTSQSNGRWDKPGSSSQNSPGTEPGSDEDPDGLPYEPDEPDEEDPELIRKRKMLQVIEEQIMLKRAFLALKTIDAKNKKPRCFTEEPSQPVESHNTLRERVNHILQFRKRDVTVNHPEVRSRRRRVPVQHDHPLRRRVEAALQQRFAPVPVEPQKSEAPPLVSSPAPLQKEPLKEEVNKSEQGFMRFLSILNKGVDIDKLTEIVNDDSSDTPQSSRNGLQINSAASSSKSPPIERIRLKDEKQSQKTGEQQKEIQDLLKLLRLSLGKSEISCLSARTQERLYGKKQSAEKEKAQNEAQQKDTERSSPVHRTRSSSSSSPSASHSRTPNPIKRRRSRSPRRSGRTSSRSSRRRKRSRYRSRDSRSKTRSKSPRPRVYQESHHSHMYPTQPYPHPQYFSPYFPPQMYHNSYVYSQYSAYCNYWTHNQASLMSPMVSSAQNYPQNIPPTLLDPETAPNIDNAQHDEFVIGAEMKNVEEAQMHGNQEVKQKVHLFSRKGRDAQDASGTQETSTNTTERKKKRKKQKGIKLLDDKPEPRIKDSQEEQDLYDDLLLNMEGNDTGGSSQVSDEEEPKPKPRLTDEEVKANLKKVLDMFNGRTKKNVTQLPGFLMPQNLIEDESLH